MRVLITAHDGFNYFGRAYNVAVFAPQDVNAAAASADNIQSMVQVIVDRGVRTVFPESALPPETMNVLLSAALAQGQTVELGGTLYADALAQAGGDAATYDAMMRHNVDMIVMGLLGLPAE
jgi:manganese/zinc/iron transport system substrate-binding protein